MARARAPMARSQEHGRPSCTGDAGASADRDAGASADRARGDLVQDAYGTEPGLALARQAW